MFSITSKTINKRHNVTSILYKIPQLLLSPKKNRNLRAWELFRHYKVWSQLKRKVSRAQQHWQRISQGAGKELRGSCSALHLQGTAETGEGKQTKLKPFFRARPLLPVMSRYKLPGSSALLSRRSWAGKSCRGLWAAGTNTLWNSVSALASSSLLLLLPAPWGQPVSRQTCCTERKERGKCKCRHFAASRKSFPKAPSKSGWTRLCCHSLQPRVRQKVLQWLHWIEAGNGTKQALGRPHLPEMMHFLTFADWLCDYK